MSSPAPAQVIQLNCPACRAPMRARLFTVIDAASQPELKQALLGEQLNLAICQSCGNPVALAAPLIYHDHEKRLYLVHFPTQLNARPEDQQRFIGDVTARLMRALPADAHRAHLLAPRHFLTLEALVDAVLEGDGITREMLQAQQRTVTILTALLGALERDVNEFEQLVLTDPGVFDESFFATLDALCRANEAAGRSDATTLLNELRSRLEALLTSAAMQAEPVDEALLEQLIGVADAQLEALVRQHRDAIGYEMVLAIGMRIDAAANVGDADTASQLEARRDALIAITERLDHELQAQLEAAAGLLREVIVADDLHAALRDNLARLDDAFTMVVEANLDNARRARRDDIVERLEAIRATAQQVRDEALTPEERFVRELLAADTPQAATRRLRQSPAQITPALVRRMNELAETLAEQGKTDEADLVRRLAREAGAMLF
jgi:hypothetical protein